MVSLCNRKVPKSFGLFYSLLIFFAHVGSGLPRNLSFSPLFPIRSLAAVQEKIALQRECACVWLCLRMYVGVYLGVSGGGACVHTFVHPDGSWDRGPAGAGTHGGPWRVSFGLCDLPLPDLPVELFSFYLCLPSRPVSLFRHHAPVRCLGALLGAGSAGRTGCSARLQARGSQAGKEAVVQGSRERTSLGSRTGCQRGGSQSLV